MATVVTPAVSAILQEFREEAAITKRVLDRVPGDKLTWKPHEKSMTLGQLAGHVPPQPSSIQEIHSTLEQGVRDAEQILQGFTDEQLAGTFCLMKGDREIVRQPRAAIVRTIMLNHWYHHRGQLSVYLRLLDVSLPVIYGRSADTDPFA